MLPAARRTGQGPFVQAARACSMLPARLCCRASASASTPLSISPSPLPTLPPRSGRVPGFLGGWDAGQASEAAAFDENFSEILVEAKWCCMAWGDWEYADLPYARPEPLGGIWSPWREPQMELPAWCDLVGKKHGNRDFTFLPQHPCAFLRNSTAADLAADDSGQYNSREQDR